jgi:hypothetical protein
VEILIKSAWIRPSLKEELNLVQKEKNLNKVTKANGKQSQTWKIYAKTKELEQKKPIAKSQIR